MCIYVCVYVFNIASSKNNSEEYNSVTLIQLLVLCIFPSACHFWWVYVYDHLLHPLFYLLLQWYMYVRGVISWLYSTHVWITHDYPNTHVSFLSDQL